MKNKLKAVVYKAVPLLIWLLIWQVAAMIIDHSYFLPSIPKTASALWNLITTERFFTVVFLTLMRVIAGLFLGVLVGIIFAVLSHRFAFFRATIEPLISIIKSTPVATIIIILWVMMSGNLLSIFIAFLMVMPIIWQNLMDGYDSIDNSLDEVSRIFEIPYFTKLKILVFPTLMKYFIPAIITASGLAWKSEIAAEIIAYTKNSIGQGINDAKYNFNSPEVFAWTVVIIVMSISLENLTKYLAARYKKT